MTAIVTVLVSQQVAPTPATLQQTGAIVSQGGTVTAPGTVTQVTQLSDLTPLYNGAKGVSNVAWASGTVTATTSLPHGIVVGDTIPVVLAGFTPAGYNGTFNVTATGASTFTFPLAANPGSLTVAGMYTLYDVSELAAQVTTFFAQGAFQQVFVLELGEGTPAEGVAQLGAYIASNVSTPQPLPGSNALPSRFYSYLVPREWDAVPQFLTLLQSYQNPSSQLYFHVTTTLATRSAYTSLNKNVIAYVESPAMGVYPANVLTALAWAGGSATATTTTAHGVAVGQWFQVAGAVPVAYNGYWQAAAGTTGTTLVWALPANPGAATAIGTLVANYVANAGVAPTAEFTAAAGFQQSLSYRPSATTKVTPFAFAYQYGVTPFPLRGNNSLVDSLHTSAVNYIDTGAEGGITNTILKYGQTKDGNDFTYWYSADWMQINLKLALANAIINGSNNSINPLYYNQQGIDTLQSVSVGVANRGITFGLVLGQVVMTSLDGPDLDAAIDAGSYVGKTIINAVPFITYSRENPGDYAIGRYAGLSGIYVPQRGFTQVIFNLVVSNLVAQ